MEQFFFFSHDLFLDSFFFSSETKDISENSAIFSRIVVDFPDILGSEMINGGIKIYIDLENKLEKQRKFEEISKEFEKMGLNVGKKFFF